MMLLKSLQKQKVKKMADKKSQKAYDIASSCDDKP